MAIHDLRQALRIFRREPALAAAAVLTLSLGIGATTALFSIVDAALIRPLPFEAADRLVVLRHRDLRTGLTKPDVAIGDFMDLRARQQSLESLAGYGGYQSTLFGDGAPLRVEGAVVTPDALRALRVQPALGRLLTDEDARPGAPPSVLVAYELWRTRLGSDASATARTLQLGASRAAVVGVLPAGFRMPGMPRTDVVVAQALPAAAPAQRKSGWIYALGRLRPSATIAAAEAELETLSRRIAREHPQQNEGSRYEALPLRDALLGDTRRPLLLLQAAVACVLLIACANVGNLLLARTLGREQELSVRLALGASRTRLAGQVLAEGLVLSLAGGLGGVLVAWRAAPALAALVPSAAVVPGLADVRIGAAAVAAALGAAVVAALLLGAVACLGLVRADRAVVTERRATLRPGANRAASVLVVAEIAVATVLLAGAGLALRSFANLLGVDPGFRPDGVVTVHVALPDGRYGSEAARRAFYDRAFAELAAQPGIAQVGAAMVTPLTGNNWTVPLQRADRALPAGQRPPEVGWQLASRGYFTALRIPLRSGRLFEPADAAGPPVVVVSESVAARFFPGESPLGKRISLGEESPEIVGIVGDVRRAALADTPRADLYFPFERAPAPTTTLFVRTGADPEAAFGALRGVIRRLEPHAVLYDTRAMTDIAAASAAATRLATRLLGGFAAIALVLAGIGVYGVMAYRVGRRTRELGTRLALGARPRDVAALVLRQGAGIAAAGLGLGLIGALLAARGLSAVLYEVGPRDPATLAATAALLGATALLASWLPARRAARIDPASSLGAD